jgi:hypothetical protein
MTPVFACNKFFICFDRFGHKYEKNGSQNRPYLAFKIVLNTRIRVKKDVKIKRLHVVKRQDHFFCIKKA